VRISENALRRLILTMKWANIYKKYKDHKEEVEKKGLSAAPSNTLPWSAKRLQKLTMCKICIWLHQIYLPVVTATPFSALTIYDYVTIEFILF